MMASVLERLHRAVRDERTTREAHDQALARRDRLIREARGDGHPVAVIAEVAGVTRQHAHKIAARD